jgi:hypothetical protein
MDPTTLAAAAAAALASLLAKGAEKFAEEFGKDAYEKGKDLLARVRKSLKGKPEAQKALTACEEAPGAESEAALAQAIEGELVVIPDLAREWTPLLQELAGLLRATDPRYHVEAKIVGAVGDGAQATFHLDPEALED